MKTLTTFIALFLCCASLFAQKKPTLMILPSDNWCTMRYFMTQYKSQGQTINSSLNFEYMATQP